jgi:hypothetical protein
VYLILISLYFFLRLSLLGTYDYVYVYGDTMNDEQWCYRMQSLVAPALAQPACGEDWASWCSANELTARDRVHSSTTCVRIRLVRAGVGEEEKEQEQEGQTHA